MSQLHGQVGYNINVYNSIDLSPQLTQDLHDKRIERGKLIDFDAIDPKAYEQPTAPFPVNDTVGYGLVLGLLWKLTGSFKFIDVQILQIILFSLLMPLIFGIATMLFASEACAWFCCIAHLFFFPILAMNVQPVRDVWAYYGVVLLLYGLLAFLQKRSFLMLHCCSIGFAVCQFIRPSVFFAVLTITVVFLCYGFIKREYLKQIILGLACVLAANFAFFWIPFLTYNCMHYHRYFVGPVGQDLVEGLGEFDNPWGYKLDDIWIAKYIEQKYGAKSGTPEFDDKALQEFHAAFEQHPKLYFINILRRLPGLILPGLPWIYYENSPYGQTNSIIEKLKKVCSSLPLFIDFLLRHVYIRLYLLLGYIGIFLAFGRRLHWPLVLLLIGVVCGGLGKLPSHIEYRYIVPFYWAFSLFVGYAVWQWYQSRIMRNQ